MHHRNFLFRASIGTNHWNQLPSRRAHSCAQQRRGRLRDTSNVSFKDDTVSTDRAQHPYYPSILSIHPCTCSIRLPRKVRSAARPTLHGTCLRTLRLLSARPHGTPRQVAPAAHCMQVGTGQSVAPKIEAVKARPTRPTYLPICLPYLPTYRRRGRYRCNGPLDETVCVAAIYVLCGRPWSVIYWDRADRRK